MCSVSWWAPRSATSATSRLAPSEVLRTADVIACEDTRRTRQLLTARRCPRRWAADGGPRPQRGGPGETDYSCASRPGSRWRWSPTRPCPGSRIPASAWWRPSPPPAIGSRWFPARPRRRRPWSSAAWPPVAGASRVFSPARARPVPPPGRARLRAADHRPVRVPPPGPGHHRRPVRGRGGERRVAVARELTKIFEEVWRGTLADAVAHLAEREPLGEHVLVVEGPPTPGARHRGRRRAALRARIAAGHAHPATRSPRWPPSSTSPSARSTTPPSASECRRGTRQPAAGTRSVD